MLGLVGVWTIIAFIAGLQIWKAQSRYYDQLLGFAQTDATVSFNLLDVRASTALADALRVAGEQDQRGAPSTSDIADALEKGDNARVNRDLAAFDKPSDGAIFIVRPDGITVAHNNVEVTPHHAPEPINTMASPPSGLTSLSLALLRPSDLEQKNRTLQEAKVEHFNSDYPLSIDAAVPIRGHQGQLVGAVLFAVPLTNEFFNQLGQILSDSSTDTCTASHGGDGTCLSAVDLQGHRVYTTFTGQTDVPDSIKAELASGSGQPPGGAYQLGNHTYAAYFVPETDLTLKPIFYIGAERSSQAFEQHFMDDLRDTVIIALFLSILASLMIVAFVRRYVVRPLQTLESGVGLVASGDYSRNIPVRGHDEFARLATNFNRMRQQINDYVQQIDRQRARLGESITALRGVSQALTTTTAGEGELVRAITGAAATMFRTDYALVSLDRGEGQQIIAWKGFGLDRPPDHALDVSATAIDRVVNGEVWSGPVAAPEGSSIPAALVRPGLVTGLWAPMHYQGRVVGSIGVFFREERVFEPSDIATLTTLANQAAVALENTRLFEQERETVRRLQELDNMKSDFLATVQHELRTPLTAIIGMADLMEMCWITWDDETKMGAISDIQVSSKNLYDIVETILDFTLLEARDISLIGQSFGVARAVFEVVDDLRIKQEKQQLQLSVTVPEDLELVADRDRVKQVLKHVLDNAIKFNTAGGTVSVSGGHTRDVTWIEVRDTGIGVDPAHHERIFDRFFQVDNTATRRYGGTGMGLSLARKIMEAHGGVISVVSVPGEGSTFRLEFPGVVGSTGDDTGDDVGSPVHNGARRRQKASPEAPASGGPDAADDPAPAPRTRTRKTKD
ncbi:MAG: ATP-binding protein [Candidatus Dormibacteria bacterium]